MPSTRRVNSRSPRHASARLLTVFAILSGSALATGLLPRPASAEDYYWDANGTTVNGDGDGLWLSSTASTSSAQRMSTSSSGTATPVSLLSTSGKSIRFGFGPAPANATNGGKLTVGNSTNPASNNPLVGTMVFNASGTSGYIVQNQVNNAGPVIRITTGGTGVPSGTGIIVNDNVAADTQFIVNPSSVGANNFRLDLGASQTWQNNSPTYGLIVNIPVTGTAGTYSLTTTGSGVITLGGANTFTGGLNVNGGTLRATNPSALSSGTVTVGAAGTLEVRAGITKNFAGSGRVVVGPGGNLTAVSLGSTGLVIAGQSGSTAIFTAGTATVTAGSLSMTGNASLAMPLTGLVSSSGTVTLSGLDNLLTLSGIAAAGTTYTLVQGAGILASGSISLTGNTVGGATIPLGGQTTQGRTTYSFSSTPTALQLAVTGSKLTLTWTGAINDIWDYSSTNWTEGSGNTFFASGDNGIIETPAAITIRPEGVVADAITVRNTSGTASFGGGALSAASLAKSNDGDLELGVAAVVTSLTLNNGSLAIVGSGSLTATTVMNNASLAYATSGTQTLAAEISGTGSISSAGGGTLSLTGTSTFTGSLASAAGSTVQIAGGGIAAARIINDGLLDLAGAGNHTVSGVVSGAGGVTKSGVGTVTLTGANTYTGPTSIDGGTLKLGHAQALGATAGSTSVASGAALDLNGQTVTGEALSLVGSGISTGGALVNSSTTSAARWTGDVTLNSSQTGIGGAGVITIAGNVGGSGGLAKYGEGIVALEGVNSYSGTLLINSGTVRAANQAALPVGVLQWNNSASSSTLDLVASGSYTMASMTMGSSLKVTTTGTGGVTLGITGDNTLGGSASKTLMVTNGVTAVLNGLTDIGGSSASSRDIRFITGDSGAVQVNGMLLGASSTLKFGIVKFGTAVGQAGSLYLNTANYYNGVTTVSTGTVVVGNALALGDSAAGTLINLQTSAGIAIPGIAGGTLDLNGHEILDEGLTINGSLGRVWLVNSNTATAARWTGATLAVGTAAVGGAGDIGLPGVISGSSGTLVKVGAGRVTLEAANTYSAAVSIEAGALALSAGGSLASARSISTAAGATFDVTATGGYTVPSTQTIAGSGTVAGNVIVDSGATLAPGAGAGNLTLSGSLTLNGGGNYNWQMLSATGTAGSTSSWDLLTAGGPLTIAATSADPFKVNLWTLSGIAPDVSGSAANFDAANNYTWTIATAAGGISGFAANKFVISTSATNGTGGFANAFGNGTFSITQSGNDLNLVYAAGVPSVITITVASGTQTQAQAGYPTLSGTTPVVKAGAGALILNQANTLTGSTTVQAGVLQLASAGALSASRLVVVAGGTGQVAPSTTTSVAGLDLSTGNGLMDVTSGFLTIAGGMTATQFVAELIEGRGDGSWTGTSGITSSTAAADLASGTPRAVGWLDNGDGSLSAAFAAPGDTNIDWVVDVLDAGNFLTFGKYDTGLPATWLEGDFNYDGVVDVLDASEFFGTGLYDAGNYNPAPGQASSVAAVPEPAGPTLLACGTLAVIGWLMRRNRPVSRA